MWQVQWDSNQPNPIKWIKLKAIFLKSGILWCNFKLLKGLWWKNFINRFNYPINHLDDPKNFFSKILTFKNFQILLPRHQIFIKIGVVHKLMISHCSKCCKTCVGSTRSFQDTFKPIPSGRFPAIYGETKTWDTL